MKICSKCEEPKALSKFYKDKWSRSGHKSECKECSGKSQKKYNQSPSGKKTRVKWRVSSNGKKVLKLASSKYSASTKGKTNRKKVRDKWRASLESQPSIRVSLNKYRSSKKGKLTRRINNAKRRAMKNHADICDFTAAQWRALQEQFDHRCGYCGKKSKGHLTQDHITPLSKGGNHTLSNIIPCCQPCNNKKYNKPPLIPVQPLLLLEETS